MILKQVEENRWLSGDTPSSDGMKRILCSYHAGKMDTYPVSSWDNSTYVDDELLIRLLVTL